MLKEGPCGEYVFRFHRPDGTLLKDLTPQRAIDACAEASLKQGSARLGLAIDAAIALPDWDGAATDRAMAIDGLFTASGDLPVPRPDVTAETTPGNA